MDLIILNEGIYYLIPVTKQIMDGIVLTNNLNCFELCDIARLKLATFVDSPNTYMMNDDSGYFIGCICK